MPKVIPFVPKPAIEKLPLAVRKDIRDKYESEKADFEATISELLGTAFTININANEVLAYNPSDSSSSTGSLLARYVEGFISALKKYLEKYGDDGKTHFNEAVTQSELAVAVNELGDKADTISADVKDGVFRILFHHTQLGYNQSSQDDPLLKAIESAPREGFCLVTKASIENDYNSEIEEVTAEIAEILAMPDVVLDPNFEENYAILMTKEDKSWQEKFGKVIFQYFRDGLLYQLKSQAFKGDDMLQEGLAEIVESKTFKVRVVKATKKKDATTETIIEDGVVYMQTTPDKWWYNVSDMGRGLVDLL